MIKNPDLYVAYVGRTRLKLWSTLHVPRNSLKVFLSTYQATKASIFTVAEYKENKQRQIKNRSNKYIFIQKQEKQGRSWRT